MGNFPVLSNCALSTGQAAAWSSRYQSYLDTDQLRSRQCGHHAVMLTSGDEGAVNSDPRGLTHSLLVV